MSKPKGWIANALYEMKHEIGLELSSTQWELVYNAIAHNHDNACEPYQCPAEVKEYEQA